MFCTGKAKASLGSCAQLIVFFEIFVTAGFSFGCFWISCLHLQILFLLLRSGLSKGFVFCDSAALVLVSPVHVQDVLKPFFVLPPEIYPSRSCFLPARHRVPVRTVLSWRATTGRFFVLDSRRPCQSRSDLRHFLLELAGHRFLPPFSCSSLPVIDFCCRSPASVGVPWPVCFSSVSSVLFCPSSPCYLPPEPCSVLASVVFCSCFDSCCRCSPRSCSHWIKGSSFPHSCRVLIVVSRSRTTGARWNMREAVGLILSVVVSLLTLLAPIHVFRSDSVFLS
jgi:hypothetical protein